MVTLALGTAGCTDSSGDAAITSRVKTAISKEPNLQGTKVSVSTDQEVVHFSGTVKSRAERAHLIAVARKVEGVKDVKTDLVVQEQKSAAKPQQKRAVQPQPKSAAKPEQKPAVEAQAKQEVRAQASVTPREPEFAGTGR